MDMLKQSIATKVPMTDLMQQAKVAETPEQQKEGLSNQPEGTSMVFPESTGSFNTMDMDYPIDIKKVDKQGSLVRSYENVPPGVGNLPMGEDKGTVIETPADYKNGGFDLEEFKGSLRSKSFQKGGFDPFEKLSSVSESTNVNYTKPNPNAITPEMEANMDFQAEYETNKTSEMWLNSHGMNIPDADASHLTFEALFPYGKALKTFGSGAKAMFPKGVSAFTKDGVKIIPKKDAVRLSRIEDANVTSKSFKNYEDGNWFSNSANEFYVNNTKRNTNLPRLEGQGAYLAPGDPRRLINITTDKSTAESFNMINSTSKARKLSNGPYNAARADEFILPPDLVKTMRNSGSGSGYSTHIGDAGNTIKNMSAFYKQKGGFDPYEDLSSVSDNTSVHNYSKDVLDLQGQKLTSSTPNSSNRSMAYKEPSWGEKLTDYAASPMTAFGYSVRNQDMPHSIPINSTNRNIIDDYVLDNINPFAWAKYAKQADKDYAKGEYTDALLSTLAALPMVPAALSKGKPARQAADALVAGTLEMVRNVRGNVPGDNTKDLNKKQKTGGFKGKYQKGGFDDNIVIQNAKKAADNKRDFSRLSQSWFPEAYGEKPNSAWSKLLSNIPMQYKAAAIAVQKGIEYASPLAFGAQFKSPGGTPICYGNTCVSSTSEILRESGKWDGRLEQDNDKFASNYKSHGYDFVPEGQQTPGDIVQFYKGSDADRNYSHMGITAGGDKYYNDGYSSKPWHKKNEPTTAELQKNSKNPINEKAIGKVYYRYIGE